MSSRRTIHDDQSRLKKSEVVIYVLVMIDCVVPRSGHSSDQGLDVVIAFLFPRPSRDDYTALLNSECRLLLFTSY